MQHARSNTCTQRRDGYKRRSIVVLSAVADVYSSPVADLVSDLVAERINDDLPGSQQSARRRAA